MLFLFRQYVVGQIKRENITLGQHLLGSASLFVYLNVFSPYFLVHQRARQSVKSLGQISVKPLIGVVLLIVISFIWFIIIYRRKKVNDE